MGSSGSDAPLIGLTTYAEQCRHGVWDELSALLPMTYVAAVTRAGGTPVLLPPSPIDRVGVLGALSGLVVTGGPDVDPASYGAAPHPETDVPRPERDGWEAALCRTALERHLPLLAICRGLQVLNVAQGGTLHQHLPDVTGTDDHRLVRGRMTPNDITVEAGSTLAGIVGSRTVGSCHHHQSLERLGEGLRPVAWAADGTVEAAEVGGRAFALGVQWHPETDADDDRLFKALVEAAVVFRAESRA